MTEFIPGPFAPGRWETCSGPSLRGHIVNGHLHPKVLTGQGIPLLDIEIARVREFDLDWVVAKAVERLEWPDEVVTKHDRSVDPSRYRLYLVKTIHVVEDFGLVDSVPWEPIEQVYPGAADMIVDPTQERQRDVSFKQFRQMDLQLYNRHVINA